MSDYEKWRLYNKNDQLIGWVRQVNFYASNRTGRYDREHGRHVHR